MAQQQPRPQAPRQPRGIRNNNEGNLKDGPFARRQPGYQGSDPDGFAIFADPQAGRAAQESLLRANYAGMTLGQIVNRYAPPGPENSPESVANYIGHLSGRTGLGVNDVVPAEQMGSIAAAMREFENGVSGGAPAQMTDAGDPFAAFGRMEDPAAGGDTPPPDNSTPVVWEALSPEQRMQLGRGDRVQLPSGEVVTLRGSPFIDQNRRASDRMTDGGINLREPNALDTAAAFGTAFSEQVPFADEAVAAGAGLVSGRGYDAIREQQMLDRELYNQSDRGARIAGGVGGFGAGLFLPGVAASGKFIGGGANALERAARAGVASSGFGALYGAGNTDGGFSDRAQGAGIGALAGFATGAGGQKLVETLDPALRAANVNAARRLSREGVDLTPGQILGQTPAVGGLFRRAEDAWASIPFTGGAVVSARDRATQTMNRAAINAGLKEIGERLPKGVNAGFEAIDYAQTKMSEAYDAILPRVTAQADRSFLRDVDDLLTDAAVRLPDNYAKQFENIIRQRVLRNFGSGGPVTGEQFKALESQLGTLARSAMQSGDGASRDLGFMIGDAQKLVRDLVARQNPAEGEAIRNINRGYAKLKRAEKAAASRGALRNEGVFSPAQYSSAVAAGASQSQRARGGAIMQGLATDANKVMPPLIGNPGTADRLGMLGVLSGAANFATMGAPIIATGLAYSGPAQKALNAVYRATDSQSAREALELLGRYAQQNPSLQPYYADALSAFARAASSREQPSRTGQERSLAPTGVPGTAW
ncbi:hypothetical protein MU852_04115 [Brevundimonas albigilva]|uniref:hypothetical protein n=1 Tax=Brevundimonas albigilva TaxID=1312364 RepID=UPI00201B6EAD|nr:hypothetical protein [Brevundimonas albigilva]UQV19056.1 hypothetical protein MU852_04115 [Brevundimonas albigilva]